MIRTIWRTTLFVLLWTLIAGFIYCYGNLFLNTSPSNSLDPEEGEFGIVVAVFFWLLIVPPLTCVWLVAVCIQIREILKLRGQRCKEGDELEKALATQILTLVGLFVGWAITDVLLYVGLFAHYIAAVYGIFRYTQLRCAEEMRS